ncbi:MAG TPA: DUF2625 family protein [Kofleriaceae bacterium]|jgi:hypothetical protein
MRPYEQLISTDPAWAELASLARSSRNRVEVLPRDPAAARRCLEQLQVTTRSPLGALAHETGGIFVGDRWLRLFGSGHSRMERTLGAWNTEIAVGLGQFLVLGDDVVGGTFAVDGGALGAPGHVFYFAPDTLEWEEVAPGHTAFMHWAFGGNVEKFYENLRWQGWEEEVMKLDGDQALHL